MLNILWFASIRMSTRTHRLELQISLSIRILRTDLSFPLWMRRCGVSSRDRMWKDTWYFMFSFYFQFYINSIRQCYTCVKHFIFLHIIFGLQNLCNMFIFIYLMFFISHWLTLIICENKIIHNLFSYNVNL